METTSRDLTQGQRRNRDSLLAARVRKEFNGLHQLYVGDIVEIPGGALGEYRGISARKPSYVTVMLYPLDGVVTDRKNIKDTLVRRSYRLGVDVKFSFYPRQIVSESRGGMDYREIRPLRPQPRYEPAPLPQASPTYPSRPVSRPDPVLRQLGDKSGPTKRVVSTPQPRAGSLTMRAGTIFRDTVGDDDSDWW